MLAQDDAFLDQAQRKLVELMMFGSAKDLKKGVKNTLIMFRDELVTARERPFQEAFSSLHNSCDRFLSWGRRRRGASFFTLKQNRSGDTRARGDSSHEYTTQCWHRRRTRSVNCTLSDWLGVALRYRLYPPSPPSPSFFPCEGEEEALFPHPLPRRNLFISTPHPQPSLEPWSVDHRR